MGQINPVTLEDVLHLQREQILVREDVAAAAEQPGLGVVLHGCRQQGIQIAGLVDDRRHEWSSPRGCAGYGHALLRCHW